MPVNAFSDSAATCDVGTHTQNLNPCFELLGPWGCWPVAGETLWISLPCSLLLMCGKCLCCPLEQTLVKTSNLNKISTHPHLKHIPGIPGKREEKTFKKFILFSGHLDDKPPANFRWNFIEFFLNASVAFEKELSWVSSCSFLGAHGACLRTLESVAMETIIKSDCHRRTSPESPRTCCFPPFGSVWSKQTQKPSLSG